MLIDSHCHFDFAPFADDPQRYLHKALAHGVKKIIVPSVGQKNWQQVSQLADTFPAQIYYALGVHPLWANKHNIHHIDELKIWLKSNKKNCVAIGECGLDFAFSNANNFDVEENKKQQITLFKKQCELAIESDLPVILHCRKAHNEMLSVLNQYSALRGVLHAFSGSEQQGKDFIKRGFYLGIGGTITYPRANKTRKAVANLPLSSMLLETDSPDMPILGRQGQPNLPQYLVSIATTLADLKKLSVVEIENQSTENTKQLFRIR